MRPIRMSVFVRKYEVRWLVLREDEGGEGENTSPGDVLH